MKLLSYKQTMFWIQTISEKTVEIWKLDEIGLLAITEYRKIKLKEQIGEYQNGMQQNLKRKT